MKSVPHCNRRQFMVGTGMTFALARTPFLFAADDEVSVPKKEGATVRAIFLYPPSEVFSDKEDGWWSWPGNEFDAEGRQKQYVAELKKMEKRLGVKILVDPKPVGNKADAQRVAAELCGPESENTDYLLRRFAHTSEGSCAVQVFWKPEDPVTMVRYYPGQEPALDVYAGRVAKSHDMPPVGGCTTNVTIEITDRPDALMVKGHHNLLFCGNFARRFRLFAMLHKMRLAKTGYTGPWPV